MINSMGKSSTKVENYQPTNNTDMSITRSDHPWWSVLGKKKSDNGFSSCVVHRGIHVFLYKKYFYKKPSLKKAKMQRKT